MKKGDKLIAIDPCIMEADGKPALIVGKEYKVISVRNSLFTIKSETSVEHHFYVSGYSDYFKYPEVRVEYKILKDITFFNKEDYAFEENLLKYFTKSALDKLIENKIVAEYKEVKDIKVADGVYIEFLPNDKQLSLREVKEFYTQEAVSEMFLRSKLERVVPKLKR